MILHHRACCLALGLCLLAGGLSCATDQQSPQPQQRQQQSFQSPQAAVDALVGALRTRDHGELSKIFGPDGSEIISSGDPVADRADSERFLVAYDAKHQLQPNANGQMTLIVGAEDWPFPVPLVKDGNQYVFDTEAGKDEILNRRIGRNELATEEVCLAIVDAERDYVRMHPMGGDLPVYASRIVSTPGKKDGLYWPTSAGQLPSPLGPLVAQASAEGYASNPTTRPSNEPPPPYHGYRYKLLTAQGPHAEGGASDYLVDGKLIGGFGVVAYPAQYGNSGIMSFITNHDGVVYQKDLGPETQKIAEEMTTFDPDPGAGWTKTTDAAQTTAGAQGE